MAAKTRNVTVSALGVSAKANPDALDDLDLFERVYEVGVDSAAALIEIGRALFGESGWAKVKDGLRDEGGKLTVTRMAEFVNEVADQLDALKN